MRSPIPIRNIYYLLSYAWDVDPLQGQRALAVENSPEVIDLLARLFASGVASLQRRGLDRGYLETTEEIGMIRGKLDFPQSTKRLSRLRSRMVCRFEELRPDILLNRILKSTLVSLLGCNQLEAETRRMLHLPREMLEEIPSIVLSAGLFRRVQLHRNNRHYCLLLNICELLAKCLIPCEQKGRTAFRDFLDDEAVMNQIFEKFVLNFAKRNFPDAKVSALCIKWDGESLDEASRSFLPIMRTDLTIEWPDRKIILDCKFYREATQSRNEVAKLRSTHLYQIFSYLKNHAVTEGWHQCEGILLYPTVAAPLDCNYRFGGHPVRAVTLDLNRPWYEIEADLIDVLVGRRK